MSPRPATIADLKTKRNAPGCYDVTAPDGTRYEVTRCDGENGDRNEWMIYTIPPSGMPGFDDYCDHANSLRDAKLAILDWYQNP